VLQYKVHDVHSTHCEQPNIVGVEKAFVTDNTL
jgi:hypothetical protein